MSNEIEAVRAKFIEYSEVFNKLDPKLILPFFAVGSILVTTGVVATMTTEQEVEGVFTQFMGLLKKQNFTHSELNKNNLSAKMLSDNVAIISGSAIHYKKDPGTDTKEVELERIGVTYTFRKDPPAPTAKATEPTDGVWKIVSGIIHKPENVIAL